VEPFILLTAVAIVALLLGTRARSAAVVWVAKPLASAGFVGVAVAAGALDTTYGQLVLVGLCLGLIGDVCLIPHGRGAFLAGLASFLLSHVAYTVAFVGRGVSVRVFGIAIMVMAVLMVGVARWLKPHLPDAMRVPVSAYITAIGLMMASAVATTAPDFRPVVIWLGAALFLASDLFVARDRFVAPGFVNRLVGLPLYYAGQVLLAASVS
jgi:uncharacterized membrane protein YhhN